MRTFLVILAVLVCCFSAFAQNDEHQIRKVLTDQVEAWNRGDIEGFMAGYWNSDSTAFNSAGNLIRGYQAVLARYRKNYGSQELMGKLEFSDLNLRMLSTSAAVVIGEWRLRRDKDQPWGRFTLIVEKKSEGWRITHDHTSSAEK
ncbi:MAG: DUF3225 domain-containing protein [Ignavibacteriales bacterium]|nr:DUF3225 domain-containing protein [Ignavibacteriales bacterium]